MNSAVCFTSASNFRRETTIDRSDVRERPNVLLQPRRLMIPPAAAGCKGRFKLLMHQVGPCK